MRTTTTAALTAAVLLATLTACGTSDQEDAMDAAPTQSALSKADLDKAREAAGLPAEPDEATVAAFIDALNAIDPRIVKPGKDDQAVSRGLNQCSSIKTTKDRATLIEQTLSRFTIDTRLPDISNTDTGGKVLDAVHKHLCPDF
ncbi:hypothetical protein ACIRD8_35070 [Streptomyces sp. NPDC102451]|uniref:hypothetical protein n=1 Tax=Streptomyces sp. NPDC102451 TaxID=3366177 RepID=UPI0037F909D9